MAPPGLMHDGLRTAAQQYGERAAVWFGDDTWSWRRLDDAAGQVAAALSGRVAPKDRVAVMASNRPEFIAVVNAISRRGAATVLLSPAWKQREVAHALTLTGAKMGFADGTSLDLLREVLGTDNVTSLDDVLTSDVASPGDSAGDVASPGDSAGDVASPGDSAGDVTSLGEISLADESVLVFSSGTTGLPKAVRHTHRSMGHAVAHWVQTLGLTDADRFQIATPPSHILGLLNLLTAAAAGATVRLHPRFDLDEVLRRIESDRMTLEMAVAPIALAMANHPSIEDYDLSSLRYIMWGATPVTPSVAELVTKRTGVRWLPAYGASELPVITVNPVNEPDRWRLDSAGLPPDGVELRVIDLDSREVLPAGETGEIQVRSASVMSGYLPEEDNADAFEDGWYRTGDVGWIEDEGWVHLTDRSKEMVKVKGFQVAPAEIEAVLHGHPGVRDCAVFAIPDLEAGERPVAAVTLVDGDLVTVDELKQLVAESLATYKQLAAVVAVEEIPRLPSGKVLRRTLSAEWTPRLTNPGEHS